MQPKIIHPVFVILPLQDDEHVARVFTRGIKPALARLGFEARRVDDQAVKNGIIDAIQREIKGAYFLIADLSFARPNCYFELGFAQAKGKPALLIKDNETPVHFDIAHQMIHSFLHDADIEDFIGRLVPLFLETDAREAEDTHNGKFGRHCIRDGFRLSAEIAECSSDGCWLNFEVSSVDPSVTLDGSVEFHMHDSYAELSKVVQTMKVKNGRVLKSRVESSDGPWTLGAKVVASDTLLELDLATIPGAQRWWYNKAYRIV